MASAVRPEEPGYRDALTGLYGPARARDVLAGWLGGAADVHAALLELGRFDAVNIAYGSDTGDHALVEVARRLLHFADDEFEEGDWLAARLGGGRFLLATREPCSRERWQWLAEALADAVAHPIGGQGETVRLWPRGALVRALRGERPEALLERLAHGLEAMRERRGARVGWTDVRQAVPQTEGAALEADLLAALDRDEIALLYQPQYACADSVLIGAEALARWEHPTLGRIGAGPLFALAERIDHVAQLSRHVAERALAEAARWPDPLRLSLNLTPADLAAASFPQQFGKVLDASGCDPARLTVEITEQVLLGDLDRTATSLAALKDRGIRIALDDFGAGFCNFRYLKTLPLDVLKLDRSMVEGLDEDGPALPVLRGIVAMARALDLDVVAEGIETEVQRAIVCAEGVAVWQGYLGAKPLSKQEFVKLAR